MIADIWDHTWLGADVVVASSAEEAASIWNAQNPDGYFQSNRQSIPATADCFIEVKPGEIHLTMGDC